MKKIMVCAVLFLTSLFFLRPAWGENEAELKKLVDKASGVWRDEWRQAQAPDVKGIEIRNEQELNLHSLRGKVVLLNFIAPG